MRIILSGEYAIAACYVGSESTEALISKVWYRLNQHNASQAIFTYILTEYDELRCKKKLRTETRQRVLDEQGSQILDNLIVGFFENKHSLEIRYDAKSKILNVVIFDLDN